MYRAMLVFCCIIFGSIGIVFWPVSSLAIHDAADNIVFQEALPLGRSFETRYIHSVQLTPVEDLYYVINGRVCQWQTRVQSQGAGLTSVTLPQGRFRFDAPWLIFEGQAISMEEFFLRVGNSVIGQNCLRLGNSAWWPLYPRFNGKRLRVAATWQRLFYHAAPVRNLL